MAPLAGDHCANWETVCAVLRRFCGFLRREQSVLRLSAIVRGFLRLSALNLYFRLFRWPHKKRIGFLRRKGETMKKCYRLAHSERVEATTAEQAIEKTTEYADNYLFFGSREEAIETAQNLPAPDKTRCGYTFNNHGKSIPLYFFYDVAILEEAETDEDCETLEEVFETAASWDVFLERVKED